MFGDDRSYKERMRDKFFEDGSMAMSSADDWEDLERFIDSRVDRGDDLSEVSLEELKRRKSDAEW